MGLQLHELGAIPRASLPLPDGHEPREQGSCMRRKRVHAKTRGREELERAGQDLTR
jgi:hypothetical protein